MMASKIANRRIKEFRDQQDWRFDGFGSSKRRPREAAVMGGGERTAKAWFSRMMV
jgi:hypothetical protein